MSDESLLSVHQLDRSVGRSDVLRLGVFGRALAGASPLRLQEAARRPQAPGARTRRRGVAALAAGAAGAYFWGVKRQWERTVETGPDDCKTGICCSGYRQRVYGKRKRKRKRVKRSARLPPLGSQRYMIY